MRLKPALVCFLIFGIFPQFCSDRSGLADTVIPKTGFPPLTLSPDASERQQSERLLAGVYVNRRERGTMIVQFLDGDYWVPWNEFLAKAGVRPAFEQDGIISIMTTIGDIRFDSHILRRIDGDQYISFRELEKQLRVFPSFNQALFAVMFEITWTTEVPKSLNRGTIIPDVTPPGVSMSFIHTGYEFFSDFEQPDRQRFEIMSAGRVACGVWDMELEGASVDLLRPVHYHWTSLGAKSAFRLGTGITESASLLDSHLFTGMQFAVSNRLIQSCFDQSFTSNQESFITFNGDQRRTIEGSGPSAGIAELRLDDRAVARQLIRLDGRFSFSDVLVGAGFHKTEVYIYERSVLEKPLHVLDYSQSISSRSLEAGKLLVNGGLGMSGNPLVDEVNANAFNDPLAFGRFRYGVSKWLTTEAAVQYSRATGSSEVLAGCVLTVDSSWSAGVYAAAAHSRFGSEMSIERQGPQLSLSLRSTIYQEDFRSNGESARSFHTLYLSRRPLQNLNLMLIGQKGRLSGDETEVNFLRPGFTMFFGGGIGVSATPGYEKDENYRFEVTWNRHALLLSTSYSNDMIDLSLATDLSDRVKIRLANQYDFLHNIDMTSAYCNWYPTIEKRAMLQFVGSHSSRQNGFSLYYHRPDVAGFNISAGYTYSMNDVLRFNVDQLGFADLTGLSTEKHTFNLSLSWDFGWSGKRFRPVNISTLSPTRGGIAGSLVFDEHYRLPESGIDKVGILINGRRVPQNQGSGSFFVGNLKPGLYRVTLDTSELPVELTGESKAKIVQVRSCGVTNLTLPVHAEYGVAGRLVDGQGNGIAAVMVRARLEGHNEIVSSGLTNDFGYYRLDGLKNGLYSVYVERELNGQLTMVAERSLMIRDDFQFEIDLQAQQ